MIYGSRFFFSVGSFMVRVRYDMDMDMGGWNAMGVERKDGDATGFRADLIP